jgi:N-dimethylarginine dimethylaminohydrolase
VADASHVDMAIAFPDIGVCVIYPTLVGYNFLRFLKKIKYEIIEVPPEEYKTCVYNMVNLGPGKVVCPDGGKRTIKQMEEKGIEVITTPQSEYIKLGGAVHCATAALIRDSGPLCKELVTKPLEEIAPELC